MKRSYVIAGLMALAATGWIVSGQVGGRPPAVPKAKPAVAAEQPLPRVRVRTLRAEERANELVLFGHTEAERKVDLRAETVGRVEELATTKGRPVAEGDLVVRLAMDDRRARLAEADALVGQYRIAYEAAKQLSEKAFRSRVKLAEAKAQLEMALAKRADIRLDIQRTAIGAPFAGVVDALPVEIGDYAAVGTVVATVVDLDPILVVADVGERDVARIAVGAAATAHLTTGEVLRGRVRYVAKTGQPATRTFRVEVAVDNPDGHIAEALTAELRLPLGRVLAHRVSPAVLTLSDEGVVGVKAVGAGDRVAFFPVTMIADTPDGIWLGGLPDTVRVITVGQEFVRVGQRVQPVPEDAAPAPGPAAPAPTLPVPGADGGTS